MKLPCDSAYEAASFVVKTLGDAGFRALFAGGCVRDILLGLTPKDYDVATSARPDDVRGLFPRARLVGANFGVVLVRRRRHNIEVATFRRDGVYSDGRHPDEVTFGEEKEDARRRDFTINGLFFDPAADEVIDYVGGRGDLAARVIRTIGDPRKRFAEDYLRLLRAPRLAARLGFSIEQSTRQAITTLAANLQRISPERIWMELEELITAPTRGRGFHLLVDLRLHQHLSPRLALSKEQCEGAARALGACEERLIDPALAIAILLVDHQRSQVREVCRSLRLSNRLTDDTVFLVDSLGCARRAAVLELADLKKLMNHRAWVHLPALLRSQLVAANAPLTPYDALVGRASAIPSERVAPPPLLRGDELLGLGVAPGPRIGRVLDAVYRAQLNETIRTREDARALAASILHGPSESAK